jgi:hypothetical protein
MKARGIEMAVRSARQESELIIRIVERALALSRNYGIEYTSAQTGLLVCHQNSNPLNLQGLLDAYDYNFEHDIFRIRRHLDRDSGELIGGFRPRFSAANPRL